MVHFSRITEITLSNFKNVEYGKVGKLEFSQGKASLLGIYGQNGSGKTALVEACLLLKYLMSGQAVPDSFVHAITADKEYSELVFSFVFSFDDINAPVYISYSFKIDAQRKMSADEIENCYQIRVFDEIIKVTCLAIPEFFSKTKLIDTSKRDSYGPLSLLNELSRGPQNTIDELKKSKFLAQDNSLSSIFNTRAMEFFKKNSNGFLNRVLEELKIFALRKLFVVMPHDPSRLNIDLLLSNLAFDENSFQNREEFLKSIDGLIVPLRSNIQLPVAQIGGVYKSIACINEVLGKLIPDLSLKLQAGLNATDAQGQELCYCKVLSCRKDVKIPLDNESNGIKKLISILQYLIAIYNRSDITVVIDELDNCVFEYLLGELLALLADHAKGQLLFTSQNLRPLEILDKKYLAFTSINSKKRYVRIRGVKANNNLRDFYYRDIQLGIQENALYESAYSFILLSMYEAGHPDIRW